MKDNRHFPPGTCEVFIGNFPNIRKGFLENIEIRVTKSIRDGEYPGAVILASHKSQIIYSGIFGNRRITPDIAPMEAGTIFDIASLTKVVATTPAIMQLIEQGELRLDQAVAHYWPKFADNGKATLTIRELLTHTSGIQPDIPLDPPWFGEDEAIRKIEKIGPNYPAGTKFIYSDINFISLGHLVQLITNKRINDYASDHLYQPLGMSNTLFLPPASMREIIAPTNFNGEFRWGEVNDPTAYAMGGVAGHAGLFSTAQDLGIYAQCILDKGRLPHKETSYLLAPLTILKMYSPQTPVGLTDIRGLGWDIDSVYNNRGTFFPFPSFGHTGWTGTSLWIDTITDSWVIFLTSRTHPTPLPHPHIIEDRSIIADIIASSLLDVPINRQWTNTGVGEIARAYIHGTNI